LKEISHFDRLSADWMEDEACPVAPELVIEIISPTGLKEN
jgi:Uma2 family endonuclease